MPRSILNCMYAQYSTGTTNNDTSSISIPENTGNAMARATSAPRPVANITGNSAANVVNAVIRQGRMRGRPGFDRRVTQVLDVGQLAASEYLFKAGRNDHAVIDCDAEQCDEANPD